MKCFFCDYDNDDLKRFTDHIKKNHQLSSEQYTINVFHAGVRPTCKECSGEVRYTSYSFKQYCKSHAKLAMSIGGVKGGLAEAWNKGKTKETDERIASQAQSIVGQGNPFYGKYHTNDTKSRISVSKTLVAIDIQTRITERSNEFDLITPLEEYKSRQLQYLEFRCIRCGTIQPKTLQAFERGSRCYKCFPVFKSNWELNLYNFVKQIFPDAISGDRTILSPKEIDVYVPSRSFGIECHGLYWHSDGSPRGEIDRTSHLRKTQLAQSKGVRLSQFFEDEWRDKRPIVESMIKYRLGIGNERIGARTLQVRELDSHEQRFFFDMSHLAGYTQSKVAFGLCNDNGVLAALSLRTPRQEKYNDCYEIARFALRPGISIPGGLSRLMKHARQYTIDRGKKTMMTYVDRRIGDGHGYVSCGFKHIGDTGVDYWYTDNVYRYDRFKFRAQNGIPEVDVAKNAGVSRIWGCGSLVLEMNL